MADKYVNVDKLLLNLPNESYKGVLKRILIQAPAADVQEVRHRHWIRREGFDYENNVILGVCSECNWKVKDFTNYCPNCGAKMDGEDNRTT